MNTKSLSYHNDPELKRRAVESAKHHRDADMLMAGTYGRMNGSFKGYSAAWIQERDDLLEILQGVKK